MAAEYKIFLITDRAWIINRVILCSKSAGYLLISSNSTYFSCIWSTRTVDARARSSHVTNAARGHSLSHAWDRQIGVMWSSPPNKIGVFPGLPRCSWNNNMPGVNNYQPKWSAKIKNIPRRAVLHLRTTFFMSHALVICGHWHLGMQGQGTQKSPTACWWCCLSQYKSWQLINNHLRAKFFWVNISIYLHFMSFVHIDLAQVPKILPRVSKGPTYSVQPISWLLIMAAPYVARALAAMILT